MKNVYWLSGPSTSQKSTTARMLSEWYGFRVEHRDDYIEDHYTRITEDSQPEMYHFDEARRGDEKWWKEAMESAPEEGARRHLKFVDEDFELTKEDLWNSLVDYEDESQLILIEGARFSPHGVFEIVTEPRRVVWLASSSSILESRLLAIHRGRWSEDKVRWMASALHGASEKYA